MKAEKRGILEKEGDPRKGRGILEKAKRGILEKEGDPRKRGGS